MQVLLYLSVSIIGDSGDEWPKHFSESFIGEDRTALSEDTDVRLTYATLYARLVSHDIVLFLHLSSDERRRACKKEEKKAGTQISSLLQHVEK